MREPEYERELTLYKVVKIYHVWDESPKDAMKWVDEDRGDTHLTAKYATRETRRDFWQRLKKLRLR
jgi:hypothetical protein